MSAPSFLDMPHRLTHNDVRRMALARPEVHEGEHLGHADLRVLNKIFASLPVDPGTVSIKISPTNLDALIRSDPDAFRNAWGGRWIGVSLGAVSADIVRSLLIDGRRLTAPAALRATHDR